MGKKWTPPIGDEVVEEKSAWVPPVGDEVVEDSDPSKKKDESAVPESTVQPSVSDGGTSGLTPGTLALPSWMGGNQAIRTPNNQEIPSGATVSNAGGTTPYSSGIEAPVPPSTKNAPVKPLTYWDKALSSKYFDTKDASVKKDILSQIGEGTSQAAVAAEPLPGENIPTPGASYVAGILSHEAGQIGKTAEQYDIESGQRAERRGKAMTDIASDKDALSKLNMSNPKEVEYANTLKAKIKESESIKDKDLYTPDQIADYFTPEQRAGYGDYLRKNLHKMYNERGDEFNKIAEKANQGMLTDEEKESMLTDAMKAKSKDLTDQWNIMQARGYDKTVSKYGAIADQAHEVEGQLEQLKQALAKTPQGSPEAAQLIDQYQKLQVQGNDYISQLHAASPEDQKAISQYINVAQQSQKASDDFVGAVKKFPSLVEKLRLKEEGNVFVASNGITGQILEVPSIAWNAIVKTASQIVGLPALADRLIEHGITGDHYSDIDRVADGLVNTVNGFASHYVSDKPMYDADGTFHGDRVLASTSQMAADMYMLIKGGKYFSSAIEGVPEADKIGLAAMNFVTSVADNKKEAEDHGMSERDQMTYATTKSIVSSLLLTMNPATKMLDSPVVNKEIGEAVKVMMNKGKPAWGKVLSSIGVNSAEITGLNILQTTSDKVLGGLYNENTSVDPNKPLSSSFSKGELYSNATMGAIIGTLVGTLHSGVKITPGEGWGKQSKAIVDNAKYLLGTDVEKSTQYITDILSRKEITQSDADNLIAQASASATLRGMMPSSIGEGKKNEIFPLLEEKSKLEADNKALDPVFQKKNEARIKEIEGAITEIFERKDKEDVATTTHPGQEPDAEDKPENNVWSETSAEGEKTYYKLDENKQKESITKAEYDALTKEEAKLQEQRQEPENNSDNEKGSKKSSHQEGSPKEGGSQEGSGEKEVVTEPAKEEKPEPVTTAIEQTPKTTEDATKKGNVEEDSKQEHQDGNEGGETAETGSGDSPEPSPEDGDKKEEVRPPSEKEAGKIRKVMERHLNAENVSDEIRQGLKDKGVNYIPRSEELNSHEAKALIEIKGVEHAEKDVDDKGNGIHPAVRVSLATQIKRYWHEAYDNAKTESERTASLQKTIEATDRLAILGTELGQAVNQFKENKATLSPAEVVTKSEMAHKAVRDKLLEGKEKEIAKLKADFEKMKTEAENKVGSTIDIKQMIADKVEQAVKEALAKREGKTPKRTLKEKHTAIDKAFDRLMSDKNKVYNSLLGLPVAIWDGSIIAIKHAVKLGASAEHAIRAGVEYIKKNHDPDFDDKDYILKHQKVVEGIVEANKIEGHGTDKYTAHSSLFDVFGIDTENMTKAKKELNEKIKDLAFGYHEVSDTKGNIEKYIQDKTGKSSEALADMVKSINDYLKEEILKKRESFEKSMIPEAKGERAEGKKKQALDKLFKAVNSGSLTDEHFKQAYAEVLGLPVLSDATRGKIEGYARTIQAFEKYHEYAANNQTAENRSEIQKELKKRYEAADIARKALARHESQGHAWEAITSTMVGNLLGPPSVMKKIIIDNAMIPVRYAQKLVSTGIDILDNKLFGTTREISSPLGLQVGWAKEYAIRTAEGLKSMITGPKIEESHLRDLQRGFQPMQAMINGMKMAKDFVTGSKTADEGYKNTEKKIDLAIQGTLGVPAEIMFRAMHAMTHGPQKAAEYARAYELGSLKGLKGEALQKFIDFPDEKSAADIKHYGEKAVFMDKSGINLPDYRTMKNSKSELIRALAGPFSYVFKALIPFQNLPFNVFKQVGTLAFPEIALAEAVAHARKGNRKEVKESVGRFVVGTMIHLLGQKIFSLGLTGQNEDDNKKKVRGAKGETVGMDNINISGLLRWMTGGDSSIRDTDTHINIRTLGPIGLILQLQANLGQKEKGHDEEDRTAVVKYLANMANRVPMTAKLGLEETFAFGVNQMFGAIMDNKTKGEPWLVNLTMAMSSPITPAIVAKLSQGSDQYQRDTKGTGFGEDFINVLKNRTFQGGSLPIKRGIFGNKLKSSPEGRNSLMYNLFDSTRGRNVDTGSTEYFVYDLYKKTGFDGVIPSTPANKFKDKNGTSQKLSEKDYDDFCEVVGHFRKNLVDHLRDDKGFNALDDEKKVRKLKSVYLEGLKAGKRVIKNTAGLNYHETEE